MIIPDGMMQTKLARRLDLTLLQGPKWRRTPHTGLGSFNWLRAR